MTTLLQGSSGRPVRAIPLGLVLGASLGVVARGWMRVASPDPEFSWAGTLMIVGAFALWGLSQGVVTAVRQTTSRRWLVTFVRVFGLVATLPLFVGAGAVMAPTVIAGGFERHRTDWRAWGRGLAGVVALLPVVVVAVQFHDDWGWTWRWWASTAGLAIVYATIIQSMRSTLAPQLDGWRMRISDKRDGGTLEVEAATNNDASPISMATVARLARIWWPVPSFIAVSLVIQTRVLARDDVGGHAAEHLSSASAPFMAAAVVGILLWATPRALRQIDVMLAALAWFATTVLVMIGNLRVVDDLAEAGYGFTPTRTVPDIADHSLANSSIWWAVAAALVLVAAFRWRRHIGNTAAAGACIAMAVPPWMIPGAGVIVLTIVRCVAHTREVSRQPASLKSPEVTGDEDAPTVTTHPGETA